MSTEYYERCRITLRHGNAAEELLARVIKRVEGEYSGANISAEAGASPKKVEAGTVFVPDGHPLSHAGVVDQFGRLIRPMGGELILMHVMEIIREEEKSLSM